MIRGDRGVIEEDRPLAHMGEQTVRPEREFLDRLSRGDADTKNVNISRHRRQIRLSHRPLRDSQRHRLRGKIVNRDGDTMLRHVLHHPAPHAAEADEADGETLCLPDRLVHLAHNPSPRLDLFDRHTGGGRYPENMRPAL